MIIETRHISTATIIRTDLSAIILSEDYNAVPEKTYEGPQIQGTPEQR